MLATVRELPRRRDRPRMLSWKLWRRSLLDGAHVIDVRIAGRLVAAAEPATRAAFVAGDTSACTPG